MLRVPQLHLITTGCCPECNQPTNDLTYMLVMETSSPKDPKHVWDKNGNCGHIFRVDIIIKAPWHNDAELIASTLARAGEVLRSRVLSGTDAAEGVVFRRDLIARRGSDGRLEFEELLHAPEGRRPRDRSGRLLGA